MSKNKLTALNIHEVSLVDKGAIGERFTLMKMADPDSQDDVLKQFTTEAVLEKMKNMSDEEFIGVMKELESKCQEINKGGNEMDPNQIKEIVKACLDESMSTVNKNFVALNKSIDELQIKVADVEKAKGEEEKKCPNCGMPMSKCTCKDGKKDDAVTKALATLTESVSKMAEGIGAIGELKTAVENLTKSQEDVTKRVETIEKQENPSNNLDADNIQKNAGNDQPKVNFWKSIIGTGVQPEQQ